jgi:GMP synthase (glutamine-hydrolysing)
MPLKVLLLQARNRADPAQAEELRSFADKTGLSEEQIVPHDLLSGPPTLSRIRNHDALMIGGSGDYYVSKGNLPDFQNLLEVLGEVAGIGHPTFASCFGFQCLVQALGGEIVFDPDNAEVGTRELTLTEEGRRDPLTSELPDPFLAQLGRKDRAATLPEGVLGLASSTCCTYQALRILDKPIWASQFHPELDYEENLRRFEQYMEGYAQHMSAEERRLTIAGFRPSSPEVPDLLRRFLLLVFG